MRLEVCRIPTALSKHQRERGKEREKLQQLKSASDEKGRSKAEATIEHLQQGFSGD